MIEYRVGQGRLHSLLLPALTSKPKGGLQLRRLPDPRGPTLKAIATSYNRGHHRLAVILACWTFLLIIAGALVTSNDAGLSVPDWPTSFGSWYKIPKLVGGVKFEHTHRMIAQGAGLLTIILAVWTWRTEKRRWMRVLGFGALGMVIVQGILGGLTVKLFLPPPVSSAHAALAQTFFCLAVAFALFTGQKWVEEQPQVEYDQRRPSLFTLTLLSIFVLYVQLILGAMFRHHGLSWWPHVVHAVVVSFVLAWTAIRALSRSIRRSRPFVAPRFLCCHWSLPSCAWDFTAFLTRVSWGRDAVQPELPMVVATVAHVAVGALLLASTVILSIQVWRHVPVAFEERLPQAQRDASAA